MAATIRGWPPSGRPASAAVDRRAARLPHRCPHAHLHRGALPAGSAWADLVRALAPLCRGRATRARQARSRRRLRRRLRQLPARARYARASLDFVAASVTALPLPDASIDLVVSFETIEHLTAQREMLAEF